MCFLSFVFVVNHFVWAYVNRIGAHAKKNEKIFLIQIDGECTTRRSWREEKGNWVVKYSKSKRNISYHTIFFFFFLFFPRFFLLLLVLSIRQTRQNTKCSVKSRLMNRFSDWLRCIRSSRSFTSKLTFMWTKDLYKCSWHIRNLIQANRGVLFFHEFSPLFVSVHMLCPSLDFLLAKSLLLFYPNRIKNQRINIRFDPIVCMLFSIS